MGHRNDDWSSYCEISQSGILVGKNEILELSGSNCIFGFNCVDPAEKHFEVAAFEFYFLGFHEVVDIFFVDISFAGGIEAVEERGGCEGLLLG